MNPDIIIASKPSFLAAIIIDIIFILIIVSVFAYIIVTLYKIKKTVINIEKKVEELSNR
ncbi:hypothetical protein [Pelotomaculum propionicicum]|uniref:Uncharacterized protein n=1 Tax=Pelotomaculum propionicicum TaxID=258475 RepID=A0A4Y7RKA8_9FIRM|nr:hypothetical protein [Pelotomaculum propionicicum]NLI14495.1 hypothetical protein [Peptococcaceae bacterium]TEB09266.1 hypothetical protein Pmgp_03255 [Pelotomaculum propionicicum]